MAKNLKNFTSKEIKEFVSTPLFDEKIVLNKDPSYSKELLSRVEYG